MNKQGSPAHSSSRRASPQVKLMRLWFSKIKRCGSSQVIELENLPEYVVDIICVEEENGQVHRAGTEGCWIHRNPIQMRKVLNGKCSVTYACPSLHFFFFLVFAFGHHLKNNTRLKWTFAVISCGYFCVSFFTRVTIDMDFLLYGFSSPSLK